MTDTQSFFHDLWYYSLYVLIGSFILAMMEGGSGANNSKDPFDDTGGKGYDGFNDGGGD